MRLKGAIIGIGNIAVGSHIPAYLQEKERVQIIAGADKSAQNLAAFQRLFPRARAYSDEEELFARHRRELDFVDICTPPGSHRRLIERAAAAGLSILCEKPLCTSMAQMDRIITAVKEAGVVFLPCHQYRYSPLWRRALEKIRRGEIGEPHLVQFEVLRREPNPGNIHWRPGWRVDKAHSGGGIVMDHGTHLFYLATQLLGQPRELAARLMCLHHRDSGLEDTAWIIIEHEGGMSRLDITWASFQRGVRYRILGRQGEIIIAEDEVILHDKHASRHERVSEGMSRDSKHSGWFLKLVQDFLDRVQERRTDLAPLREAAMSVQCALAAYRAAEQARQLPIPPLDF